mmetsp:Transcript_48952/g.72775  ORF Transcript_48952/g.72775 Transcript_48952/m.72775 type:complete len:321 (+) Transcript_48952:37-999(+)
MSSSRNNNGGKGRKKNSMALSSLLSRCSPLEMARQQESQADLGCPTIIKKYATASSCAKRDATTSGMNGVASKSSSPRSIIKKSSQNIKKHASSAATIREQVKTTSRKRGSFNPDLGNNNPDDAAKKKKRLKTQLLSITNSTKNNLDGNVFVPTANASLFAPGRVGTLAYMSTSKASLLTSTAESERASILEKQRQLLMELKNPTPKRQHVPEKKDGYSGKVIKPRLHNKTKRHFNPSSSSKSGFGKASLRTKKRNVVTPVSGGAGGAHRQACRLAGNRNNNSQRKHTFVVPPKQRVADNKPTGPTPTSYDLFGSDDDDA